MRRLLLNARGASIIGVILVLAVLTLSGVIFVSIFSTGVENLRRGLVIERFSRQRRVEP